MFSCSCSPLYLFLVKGENGSEITQTHWGPCCVHPRTGQMQIKTGCQNRLALDGCGCSQPSCLPCSPDEPSVPPSAGSDYFMKQLLNQQRFSPLISNEGVLKFPFKSEGVTLEGMGDFLKTSFRSRRQVRKQNGCERLLRRNKQPSIIQVSVFAV